MSYRTGSLVPRWRWNSVTDTGVLFAVWSIVLVATNITTTSVRSNQAAWGLVLFVVGVSSLAFWIRGLYETPRLARTDEISRIMSTTTLGAALTAVAASFTNADLGAWELVLGTTFSIGAIILGRGIVARLGSPTDAQRVVIVGAGAEAKELVHLLQDHPEASLSVVGVIGHKETATDYGLSQHWIGPPNQLIELMEERGATGAIVTPTGFRNRQFRELTRTLFDAGFDIHLSTGVTHIYSGRFEIRPVVHEPLVRLTNHNPYRVERVIKRLIDVVGASVLLLLASPFMLLTAAAIKLEDRGPVLFRQTRKAASTRVGPDGRIIVGDFQMLKFRSMVVDAEQQRAALVQHNQRSGPIFKISTDPRITRVGRLIRELSIDELPQLVNVLRGEMSLVGPRPALQEEEASFDEQHKRRFGVKPGITGLWQVEARANGEFRAYRRLDLHYVENWSLGLDVKIFFATAAYVIVELLLFPFRRILPSTADGVAGDKPVAQNSRPEDTTSEIDLVAIEQKSRRISPSVPIHRFTTKNRSDHALRQSGQQADGRSESMDTEPKSPLRG